jgi:hypothetical protein
VRDEDGRPVIESRRVVVGQFSGLRALDPSRLNELTETFAAIALALEKAQQRLEPTARKVDKWVNSFDRLSAAERLAERLKADLHEFMVADNLDLLRFVGHYAGQPSLGFVAIAGLTSQVELQQSVAERAAQEWIAAICSRLECDRFLSHGV